MSPIYESGTISRDKLYELRKKQTCAVCGGMLNVFLDPESGKAFLACNDYLRSRHEGIAKEARYFQPNIKTKEDEMVKEHGTEKTKELMPYYTGALKTEGDAMKVLDTIWPDAPRPEKIKAALLCVSYQLNPLMKHVFLIPFESKRTGKTSWATVLGIQANRLIAHRAGDFSYIDNTPRLMTKEEQEKIFGEVFDDRIWAITKLKDSKGNEAPGYGFWMRGENPFGTEKGNTKANMAFIRSERQAMDRLFAGKMPEPQIEVIDEAYVEVPDVGKVSKATGEIIKAESVTAIADKPEPEPEPLPEDTESTTQAVEEETSSLSPAGLDLEWLKEQLAFLQSKGLKGWSNANVLAFMKTMYNVEGTTPVEAASKLSKNQSAHLTKKVQEAIEMS